MSSSKEPTRVVPATATSDGRLQARSVLTPASCKTRAKVNVPPARVLPIIFIPGIMGSNLKATSRSRGLKSGTPAWRPPNGEEALNEVSLWKSRSPATRQKILDGAGVVVDDSAVTRLHPLHDSIGLTATEAKENGWGEIHSDSYQTILFALRRQFYNFLRPQLTGGDSISNEWMRLNIEISHSTWKEESGLLSEISECDVRRLAELHYPVYACGYNWLASNANSANALKQRIEQIIGNWRHLGRRCENVILVTHSMGGLVARACAKEIPEKIAGIVHGCMPALGAPACYRRIACGTEKSSPGKGKLERYMMSKVAVILGESAADTVPVIGNSAGAIELLPNHRYPMPWLFASIKPAIGDERVYPLEFDDPYKFYANVDSWYRLVDPELLDPARLRESKELAVQKFRETVRQAEVFHKQNLGDYYHPNTYAFYGVDENQCAYGNFTWMAKADQVNFSELGVASGRLEGSGTDGQRLVRLTTNQTLQFTPSQQDSVGDGTVPILSGQDPDGKIVRTFRTTGYDHQGGFNNVSMICLTLLLVSRIALQNV